ncbi:hypothetical protein PMAYCL1PPCAC_13622, partial [Pristionchus mayeri]
SGQAPVQAPAPAPEPIPVPTKRSSLAFDRERTGLLSQEASEGAASRRRGPSRKVPEKEKSERTPSRDQRRRRRTIRTRRRTRRRRKRKRRRRRRQRGWTQLKRIDPLSIPPRVHTC